MDSQVDTSRQEGQPEGRRESDAVAAAGAAAAAGPLAQRVSELETVLAVERAEAARRLREMDALMRQTRSALHELQSDYRRTVSERDELRENLEVRDGDVAQLEKRVRDLRAKAERAVTVREGATADVVAAAIARAQRAEVELARARHTIVALHERVRQIEEAGPAGLGDAADERIAMLERRLAQRDLELIRAAEALTDYEERLARGAAQAMADSPAPATADSASESDDAVVAPGSNSSTYIPVDADVLESRSGPGEDASGTYLPVVADSDDGDGDALSAPRTASGEPAHALPESAPPCALRMGRPVVLSRVPSPRRRPPLDLPVLDGVTALREVARDGDGVLLHARDAATARAVVVRVLPSGTVRPSGACVDRLLAVRHHNVAAALRCDLGQSGPYVVSERPAGERADAWIRRVGRVSERIALAVVLQVARGLRAGDQHGVHHGDLSPTCLWMDAAGVVRVSGLGLRALLPHRDLRAPAAFVSRERLRGDVPDARSDMFALGVCLRFLLGGPTAASDAGRLHDVCPAVSPRVSALAATLAATDAGARPESWDEAIRLVTDCLQQAEEDIEDARDPPLGIVATMAQRPHLALGALALIAVLVTAWVYLMPGDESAVRKAFVDAVDRAQTLEGEGNIEGARRIYLEFVEDTGDPDIELDAARRLDALRDGARGVSER